MFKQEDKGPVGMQQGRVRGRGRGDVGSGQVSGHLRAARMGGKSQQSSLALIGMLHRLPQFAAMTFTGDLLLPQRFTNTPGMFLKLKINPTGTNQSAAS